MEEWRPAPGYESLYEISSLGRVRRVAPDPFGRTTTFIGRILKQNTAPKDNQVTLTTRRRADRKSVSVHNLVAEAFLGPKPRGLLVNHIDANKRNNRRDNLEYTTPTGNGAHAARNGLYQRGEEKPTAKLSNAAIDTIRRSTESGASLARRFGVTRGAIYHVRKGRTWTSV